MTELSEITVAVNGALGKMGQTVMSAVEAEPGLALVAGADPAASNSTVSAPGTSPVPLSADIAEAIAAVHPRVVVDFSNADGAMATFRAAAAAAVSAVSGSTGLSDDDLQEAAKLADDAGIGIISAPNFALGAILLTHLARISSAYFDYADLIESHHEAKIDAPSGTALSIAQAMIDGRGRPFEQNIAEKETLKGARGGDFGGINLHSARMPGRVARHEVVFGATGQTLTLIHDSTSRDSFMPGVMLAIRQVVETKGLVVGLDRVLGLDNKP
ncbi:MAG: 4-hydroxy-tetrahydrodipicolinate reductase [Chloroflexi bacterium]|nr:4-hydroxy-tetrahydrodipicolinate reductase [Chloroflexota bacterium]